MDQNSPTGQSGVTRTSRGIYEKHRQGQCQELATEQEILRPGVKAVARTSSRRTHQKQDQTQLISDLDSRDRCDFHIRKSGELSCPETSVPEPPVTVTTNSDAPVQIPTESILQAVETTKNTRVSRRPKAIKYRATAMIATVETNDTENSQTHDCTTRRSQRLRKPNPKVQNFELYS